MHKLGLAVLIAGSLLSQQAGVNLSGTWSMDVNRSESAHQDVAIGPVTMIITQTDADLTIETLRQETKSSVPVRETLAYKLDGSESKTSADPEHSVMTKAHWDGAALVTETTRNVRDSTVTTLHAHRLGAGGREMVVEKTLMVQHGYQFPGARTTGRGTDIFVKKSR